MMNGFDYMIAVIDHILKSKRKRHIVGGILLSISTMFSGLAITAMTLDSEDDDET